MDTRKKIGLAYDYSPDWIGGAYYIASIVKALCFIPEEKRPEVIIFYKTTAGLELLKESKYPFLQFYRVKEYKNFFCRVLNKFSRTVGLGNVIYDSTPRKLVEKYYCEYNYNHFFLPGFKKHHYWIPDFQEDYYPSFFNKKEIELRKNFQKKIALSCSDVTFSSNDALSDFVRLYPEHNCELSVLHFASVNNTDFNDLNINLLLQKYQLKKPYFFVANQFWQHKNHLTVFKALALAKIKNKNFTIAFSGKQHDHRNKDYFSELQAFCNENDLSKQVNFLGFIDRKEQLQLMAHSISIIQPSLFEGWSTVVEDAKFLNKHILLSNLAVHKEQASYNVSFFDALDHGMLAKILLEKLDNPPIEIIDEYKRNIVNFGLDFLKIME